MYIPLDYEIQDGGNGVRCEFSAQQHQTACKQAKSSSLSSTKIANTNKFQHNETHFSSKNTRPARRTWFVPRLRIIIIWLPLINVERVHKIIPTQPVLKSTEQVKSCPSLLGQITTGCPSRLVLLRVSSQLMWVPSYHRVVLLVNLEIPVISKF